MRITVVSKFELFLLCSYQLAIFQCVTLLIGKTIMFDFKHCLFVQFSFIFSFTKIIFLFKPIGNKYTFLYIVYIVTLFKLTQKKVLIGQYIWGAFLCLDLILLNKFDPNSTIRRCCFCINILNLDAKLAPYLM